jgi:uncharacterized protein
MIGRQSEIANLERAMSSSKAELVAVFGRRRVGKTYLIQQFFKNKIDFELTGLKDGNKEQQLRNFAYSLKDAQKTETLPNPPKDWLEAFFQLKNHIESLPQSTEKRVIFIDELPWIATAKSDFLTGFSYFWNSFATKKNIVVVICGSATAWMIQKIINDKGGLHNRVTQRIYLQPFTLAETEAFFESKLINFERYQTLLLYMAMGGIPSYLDHIDGNKSAIQNIDELCFSKQGILRTEFENLYSSLFNNPTDYEVIIAALASKWMGMTRMEILSETKMKDGGGFSTQLKELELSGFISSYSPFGKKKKEVLYRLTDNYSLFYLKFIKDVSPSETIYWSSVSQTQSWKSWSGYAFENICLQHIEKIKTAIGIAGIQTNQYSFYAKKTEETEGTQIDLLIDRQDNAISICEIKFYNDEWALTKAEADGLLRKRGIFKQISKTKKQLFIILISTFRLTQNKHSLGLINNCLDLNDIF